MEASNIQSLQTISRLDKVGTFASLACAVHCLLIPFILTVLPLIGLGFLTEPHFEIGMIVFAVAVATMSLCWGSHIHGTKKTLLFVAAALLFFIVGHSLHSPGHWYFMALGGLCLVAGHLLNRKLCHSCKSCCGN